MNKNEVVAQILSGKDSNTIKQTGYAFAPANIALVKYWGKRNSVLNLPMTSSLSISLGDRGTNTHIALNSGHADEIYLNTQHVNHQHVFAQRLIQFLDLIRPSDDCFFKVDTQSNIPVAAGMASSASGFAALVLALNQLFDWQLVPSSLSILARLGSGSACRSLWHGFVHWHCGTRADGMDSYASAMNLDWEDLQVGLLIVKASAKPMSSTTAMQHTVSTSPFYTLWPVQVEHDITEITNALKNQSFEHLGEILEANALAMHALMLSARPAICYHLPESTEIMHRVWALRKQGIPVYFTQDAGPNIKLIFLKSHLAVIQQQWPDIVVVKPFSQHSPQII